MDGLALGAAIGLVYIVVGIAVAKTYHRKKHGAPLKVINGGVGLFFTPAYYLAWVWPLAFVVPSLKDPAPCNHPDHMQARQYAA